MTDKDIFYKKLDVIQYYCECVIDEGAQILSITNDCNKIFITNSTKKYILNIKNKIEISEISLTIKFLLNKILDNIQDCSEMSCANDMPEHVTTFLKKIKDLCIKGKKIDEFNIDFIDEIDWALEKHFIDQDSIFTLNLEQKNDA